MIYMYKIMFFNLLILGTLITISSYSWFSMWIGMEMNLLAIIPIMFTKKNKLSAEAATKYFFTQTLASSIILYSIIAPNSFIHSLYIPSYTQTILNSAILLKMGAAPFHFWYPEVIQGLSWSNILIMSTWQKIAPMIMLSLNMHTLNLITISIICSSLISGIQGLNQTNLRKIIAYSSINHTSWMLATIILSSLTWLFYFLIYFMIMYNLIFIFNKMKMTHMNQLSSIFSSNKLMKTIFFFNFLSMGGLPPFMGFLPKWLTIMILTTHYFYFMSLILIISTLITLYYYLRLTFSTFSFKINEPITFKLTSSTYSPMLINILMLMGLLTYPTFYGIM